MKINKILILSFIMALTLGSCSKNDDFDPAKQAELDEALIVKFIADNKITATKHSSGVYYQILSPGTGSVIYNANTVVTAKYTGRLLNGSIFDQTTTQIPSFALGKVIVGWQIGVPLIQKGGKIRILIPSQYGYGRNVAGTIPANSVLDFDIELTDVK
ncbi:FKBP-type peptidyl-prolyl cis-trans isomerase [Daejeonella sp.]|uniref:FKBP-type peptidyl-prolyl cis-trans isomerase n=1 Tax=Daejeonella sp. TaxID=2805397 RepID=UPI0025C2A9F9|nr:FKBP-type peptidyl-prolyl cis-trans isomerase [Daejeonella sp.]